MFKRGLVALILVGSLGVMAPHTARADMGVEPTGFDVEAQGFYCSNGVPSCTTTSNIRFLTFVNAQAVSYTHTYSGTPDGVDFVCGYHYFDYVTGHPHAINERANPGIANVGGTLTGYGPGWIKGTATVAKDATETNTHAYSSMNIVAYDAVSKDFVRAWGTQITNNVTDLAVGEPTAYGFSVSLHGPRYDTDLVTGDTTRVGFGDIGCHTSFVTTFGFPSASDTHFFEGTFDNSDND